MSSPQCSAKLPQKLRIQISQSWLARCHTRRERFVSSGDYTGHPHPHSEKLSRFAKVQVCDDWLCHRTTHTQRMSEAGGGGVLCGPYQSCCSTVGAVIRLVAVQAYQVSTYETVHIHQSIFAVPNPKQVYCILINWCICINIICGAQHTWEGSPEMSCANSRRADIA